MANASNQEYVVKAVLAKVFQAKRQLEDAESTVSFRNNPMYGFKPADYIYPKISKHAANVQLEEAQENLTKWTEAFSYIEQLFKEINNDS